MTSLAPEPDFRYVGLAPGPRVHASTWASIVGAEMTLGAGLVHELGLRGLAIAGAGALVTALALRRGRRPFNWAALKNARPMAIVPWGILVDPDSSGRALHWAAVQRVTVDMVHARDTGSSSTLFSVVTIETEHERLAGRAHGAVGIERLLAHLGAWAEEQSHDVALDLDGARAAEGPLEPVIEPLLSAARACVQRGGEVATRLGLPAAGYRRTTGGASTETIDVLRKVLRDRAPRSPDPRALAAVLAAELRAAPLAEDLLALVQSPHPVVASAAKVAAHKLGVVASKAGAVSEVAPFLHERDVETLEAWTA